MHIRRFFVSAILLVILNLLPSCGNPTSSFKSSGNDIDTGKSDEKGIDISKIACTAVVENPMPTAFLYSLSNTLNKVNTGFIEVHIVNTNTQSIDLNITVRIEGYSNEAIKTVTISPNNSGTVYLNPLLSAAGFSQLTESKMANCRVKVTLLGSSIEKDVFSQSYPTQLLAKDVMVWGYGSYDLSPLVAAWVTPHASKIKELVGKAVAYHPQQRLIGYQGSDSKDGYAKRKQTDTGSISVSAGHSEYYSLGNGLFFDTGYMSNIVVSGNITSTGGFWGDDIIIQLLSSGNELLYNSGKKQKDSFSVPIARSGYYYVCFDNSFSFLTDKYISYSISRSYDEDLITPQVKAIYDALQKDYGIKYVNSVISFPDKGAQTIRFPEESLANGSANCIDGTVLFASALEYIGIEPLIILIPGHAFVGWKRWTGIHIADFLETTMMSTSSFEDAQIEGNRKFAENNGKAGTKIIDVKLEQDTGLIPLAKPVFIGTR